jgi:hypothetical protein
MNDTILVLKLYDVLRNKELPLILNSLSFEDFLSKNKITASARLFKGFPHSLFLPILI